MATFRKRPVEIEAFRFEGGEMSMMDVPSWYGTAVDHGDIICGRDTMKIRTLEGVMTASVGDWIIKGVEGEIYPCKPSVFEATYEPVVALTAS